MREFSSFCRHRRLRAECGMGIPSSSGRFWLAAVPALRAFLLVFCLTLAHADPAPETARFRSLTDVDGLSQLSALAIAQDRDGFLWIGTQVGLNRYDGATFRTFIRQRGQRDSLSEHYISALLTDADGALWVGTLNGLNRFDPMTETFISFLPKQGDPKSLPHQKINALLRDRTGALWIASDGGLSRYRAATGDFETFVTGLGDRRVQALALDDAEGVYVGTAAGLLHFDSGTGVFSPITGAGEEASALRDWINTVLFDRSGELWIGTKDFGLLRYTPRSGALRQWRHNERDGLSISHDRVYALLEDRAGRLWVGTEAGADLMQRASAVPRFVRFQHRPQTSTSIGAGRVVTLFEDVSGDLWFGTWSGGASLLSPVRSRFLSFDANVLDPGARDTAEIVNMVGADGDRIWLGTRRGLFLFDASDHSLQSVPAASGMLVYAVARDADTLLLGTDQGVARYDPHGGSLRPVILPPPVGKPFVDFIVVEADRIWISTRDADLFVLDRGLKKVLAHHVLDSREHFMADFDANLKIFGGDKGLYWFSADGLSLRARLRANPDDVHGLQSDTCHYFLRAADGQGWVATAAGLHRLDAFDVNEPLQARFTVFNPGAGANMNAIKSIVEDHNGQLWMSSNAGISRFDPHTQKFKSYTAADGAIDRGYYAFVQTVTSGGRIAFGGASGFTIFDPLNIGALPPPPHPLLTTLELDDRVIEPHRDDAVLRQSLYRTPKLVLPPGRARGLGLTFASPYFVAPEQLRFSYRLDGFQDEWIETDAKRRSAIYTNLAPGDYLFQVRVRTADADWVGAPTRLALTIAPFWWQTWWTRAAAALAMLAVVWAVFFVRQRRAEHQRRLLARQVHERTADITKLGQIGRELTATLDFEQAAERVYRQVRARLDAHVFLIAIHRPGRAAIDVDYLVENDSRRPKIEYGFDEIGRPAAWCVREGRELVAATRAQLADQVQGLRPALQGEAMESVIYLPLRIERRIIGCLSVQSPRQHAYTPAHLEFVRALASYTAIALDNADNYRSLDQSMTAMQRTNLELEKAYARIEELSRTDPLTGLGNRRSLDLRLPALLETLDRGERLSGGKARLAFFVLDVDRFKAINDQYGHTIGDLVLGALGDVLKRQFREPGFVIRWGGEEFLAVVPVDDDAEALHQGELLRIAVAAHGAEIGAPIKLHCTISIGFACYPFDPTAPRRLNWERVVEVADGALYAAKRDGRNRVFGYRCRAPIDGEFEARLRRGAEAFGSSKQLELLAAETKSAMTES
jgi:diguanylate cyclase (GGDEF)-like protein